LLEYDSGDIVFTNLTALILKVSEMRTTITL